MQMGNISNTGYNFKFQDSILIRALSINSQLFLFNYCHAAYLSLLECNGNTHKLSPVDDQPTQQQQHQRQ
mgnify:CR=1 FL=1